MLKATAVLLLAVLKGSSAAWAAAVIRAPAIVLQAIPLPAERRTDRLLVVSSPGLLPLLVVTARFHLLLVVTAVRVPAVVRVLRVESLPCMVTAPRLAVILQWMSALLLVTPMIVLRLVIPGGTRVVVTEWTGWMLRFEFCLWMFVFCKIDGDRQVFDFLQCSLICNV